MHNVLLAGLTGSPDVVVGTPVSGRTVPGLHGTLGMFANTVCLRTDARPDGGFADFLRHSGQVAEDAIANQDHPFEDLAGAVIRRRDYGRNPLFDALIAVHSERYLRVDFAGARVPLRLHWTGQSVFDLNLQIYQVAGGLRLCWEYASALLRRDTVASWLDAYLQLIDAVLADPQAPLGDLAPSRRRPAMVGVRLDFDL